VADAVPRVLPSLVLESLRVAPGVLDETVAVTVAVPIDPVERSIGCGEQRPNTIRQTGPSGELTDQHHEQRSRVDGAVVRARPAEQLGAERVEPHFVEDPSGLLLGTFHDLGPLRVRQLGQHTGRELVIEGQRHPAREDGVAAEQRHEPGCARGDHDPIDVVGIEDPQRPQIGQ
jgi:hypothetical protein